MHDMKTTRSSVRLLSRLSLMMFLQYFVQGAYLPIVSVYVEKGLGFSAFAVGAFGSALAVGPILAPFLIGQLADRHFATQRLVACCHFAAGVLMIFLYFQTQVWAVILIGTVYSVLYVPTMMLTNSLAFQHLGDSKSEFPIVRLFGTIGFIVPAYVVEFYWLRGLAGDELNTARGVVFLISGVAGLIMALYCLSLPHTPPQRKTRDYAPWVILRLMKERQFLVFVLASFLIGIAHKFFFVWNSPFLRAVLDSGGWTGAYEQSISSIGQICEVAVMLVLGFSIARFGFKRVLIAGAAAYAVRCFLFASVFWLDPAFTAKLTLVAIGQALHGFCFGCFLATGFIFVDRVAPKDARGSMQTIYGTMVLGLGFFVGGLFSGWIGTHFTTVTDTSTVRDWTSIWASCGCLALVVTLGLAVLMPKSGDEATE